MSQGPFSIRFFESESYSFSEYFECFGTLKREVEEEGALKLYFIKNQVSPFLGRSSVFHFCAFFPTFKLFHL